jgi:hypothetical protein
MKILLIGQKHGRSPTQSSNYKWFSIESGLINCDCKNILDVPAEAISIAVCVYMFESSL